LAHQDRVNIAVFIDFDNIEIGVRTTLNDHFDVGIILEALKERGEVVTKIAYADWTRAGEYSRALTQHAIRLVQRNLTPGGDKNGADINLALDALEMAFTHPHINAYVIVGGDSDFLSLVEKLKQYDKKVFVIGGRAFTSVILQRNCHEFIAYENLVRKPAVARGGRPPAPTMASSPLAQAFPIVRRALKILADREVSPQTGLLKSTLLQLDSTFSERNYGASSFLDFAEKLAQSGLVQLKHSGRSVMVELTPGFSEEGDGQKPRPVVDTDTGVVESAGVDVTPAFVPSSDSAPAQGFGGGFDQSQSGRPAAQEPPVRLGDNADGVRVAGQHMAAASNARWPMYLRNVKQILRAAGFDERKYGFGGLLELLKACQREGLVRVERDRRGGLRVFQGSTMPRTAVATPAPQMSTPLAEPDTIDVQDDSEPIEAEPIETETVTVVDTTAELLGRATAKPRRPRGRVSSGNFAASPSPTPARGSRAKAGARKTSSPRRRTKKSSDAS
jgi:uncharacterized protein (TIGR00288 family)